MREGYEYRFSDLESTGRTIRGIAIRYGDTAVIARRYKERFEAGAFGDVALGDYLLNFQHDRTRPLCRSNSGLVLTDTPEQLTLVATLPKTRDCDDALTLIREGVIRGLSVEFRAIESRVDMSSVRVISKAILGAIAVVDKPAYSDSELVARMASEYEPHNLTRKFFL